MKDRFKCDEENRKELEIAYFVRIAVVKDLSDMEFYKGFPVVRKNRFTGMMMMYYNIRGITSLFVLWIFAQFYYEK